MLNERRSQQRFGDDPASLYRRYVSEKDGVRPVVSSAMTVRMRDLGSRTARSSRHCVEPTTFTRPFKLVPKTVENSLVNCFQRYLTSKQIDVLTSVSDRIYSSVDRTHPDVS